ncbi:hypothetical protein GUITHDRAFT_122346 [Guillardia theta CCMP2712]|uniref:Uncharacterized protein n=1 Tax=Guillardia theta (strain CCMP2712) TaxID=905079 RepID=L1I6H6_GUITC|nr:hypothetical protein GUITHDRAFT_122346 [Guillardia theta CCMP2712]EKX31470.1 hypothetical protein GUITHDRAFT_122346 [Guillardia theta CCMP2712]|eukprot:XP_005818450.1 hypothetical protein GUITHDRAFT_122346 [Guillardia theta CCMP2712]
MSRDGSDDTAIPEKSHSKEAGDGGVQGSGSVGTNKGGRMTRAWTEIERNKHKIACKGKTRLKRQEKLEIIRLHNSSDPEVHKTKAELASMFKKSLSAIAKILKPESIANLRGKAEKK